VAFMFLILFAALVWCLVLATVVACCKAAAAGDEMREQREPAPAPKTRAVRKPRRREMPISAAVALRPAVSPQTFSRTAPQRAGATLAMKSTRRIG
jgi:hypothetical protein